MATIVKTLRGGLLALVVATCWAPVWAETVGEVAKRDVTGAPQEQMPWMSGGVSYEARDEMRRAAAAYNVHLMFSNRQGSYLADIPFTVSKPNGRELYSGVSEGPLLYLKLPPGSYQIAVQLDGVWQNRRIRAGTSGNPAKASFVGNGK
ncbi:MAG: hypothetical protein ACOYB3_03125 [Azonexus sp.]